MSTATIVKQRRESPHKIRNYTKVKYLLYAMEWRFSLSIHSGWLAFFSIPTSAARVSHSRLQCCFSTSLYLFIIIILYSTRLSSPEQRPFQKNVWGSARCAATSDGEWVFFFVKLLSSWSGLLFGQWNKKSCARMLNSHFTTLLSATIAGKVFSNLKNSMNEREDTRRVKNKLQLWSSGGWSVLILLFVLYIDIYFLFIIKKRVN